MDAQEFIELIRNENETELSRLGSSKALYAVTGGEMNGDRVRAAATADARAAAETFDGWAAEAADDTAADLFADGAATAEQHAEQFDGDGAERDPESGAAEAPAVYGALADLDGTVERVAGAVARALVVGTTAEQMVGFFVGDADPRAADDFRSYRGDVETHRDRAAELLADRCGDDDWDRAREAADAVVAAAYDEYVETLESMGVQPKNVC